MEMTKIRKVKLEYIADVYKFVELAGKVNGRVEITTGCYCVDGASLLGIFSIDPSREFAVEYPADANDFDTFVSKFAC